MGLHQGLRIASVNNLIPQAANNLSTDLAVLLDAIAELQEQPDLNISGLLECLSAKVREMRKDAERLATLIRDEEKGEQTGT